jgi:hypothetical protein
LPEVSILAWRPSSSFVKVASNIFIPLVDTINLRKLAHTVNPQLAFCCGEAKIV